MTDPKKEQILATIKKLAPKYFKGKVVDVRFRDRNGNLLFYITDDLKKDDFYNQGYNLLRLLKLDCEIEYVRSAGMFKFLSETRSRIKDVLQEQTTLKKAKAFLRYAVGKEFKGYGVIFRVTGLENAEMNFYAVIRADVTYIDKAPDYDWLKAHENFIERMKRLVKAFNLPYGGVKYKFPDVSSDNELQEQTIEKKLPAVTKLFLNKEFTFGKVTIAITGVNIVRDHIMFDINIHNPYKGKKHNKVDEEVLDAFYKRVGRYCEKGFNLSFGANMRWVKDPADLYKPHSKL